MKGDLRPLTISDASHLSSKENYVLIDHPGDAVLIRNEEFHADESGFSEVPPVTEHWRAL